MDWTEWRDIASTSPNPYPNEATLDAKRKITPVTGISGNNFGWTSMLKAQLSDGSSWGPHGTTKLDPDDSERPSPSSPPLVLSHLSGDATKDRPIIRFHWRPH